MIAPSSASKERAGKQSSIFTVCDGVLRVQTGKTPPTTTTHPTAAIVFLRDVFPAFRRDNACKKCRDNKLSANSSDSQPIFYRFVIDVRVSLRIFLEYFMMCHNFSDTNLTASKCICCESSDRFSPVSWEIVEENAVKTQEMCQ